MFNKNAFLSRHFGQQAI